MRLKYLLIVSCFSLFTFHFSIAQSWIWGTNGIGDGEVFSIATDTKGNCYLSGLFPNNMVQFGTYTLTNSTITNYPYSTDDDVFLVKYAPNGIVLWAKQNFEVNSSDLVGTGAPCQISTDGVGNIYSNGNFPDTLIVGTYTLIVNPLSTWSSSTYLAKYDPNGNVLWAKQAIVGNDSSSIYGKGISSDINGNTFVTGTFLDTIQFGLYKIFSPGPYSLYTFLVKYDSAGNVKWASQSTGNSTYGATSLAVGSDQYGNSIITGYFEDTVVFGSYKLSAAFLSQTEGSLFVVKYDSMGNVVWAKQAVIANVNSGCSGWAITTDKIGNIYIGGDFDGTVTLDSFTLNGSSLGNIFLAKYDPNGNVLWVKQSTGLDGNNWGIGSLSIDNAKHIYLSGGGGIGHCKVAFGNDTLSLDDTAKLDVASIILKLDSNGNLLCSSIISGGAHVWNYVVSDTSGKHVYFGATAITPMIFGQDTVNPFSVPINQVQKENFFPFVARWQACDTNIFASVNPNKNSSSQVLLYPNPNNGMFTIALQNIAEPAQVEVYNVLGEEIYQSKLNYNSTQINLGVQPEGVYFYRVVTESEEFLGSGELIIEK
jgi:hypothetical protein